MKIHDDNIGRVVRLRSFCGALLVIAGVLIASMASADNWPQYRGMNRDSNSAEPDG